MLLSNLLRNDGDHTYANRITTAEQLSSLLASTQIQSSAIDQRTLLDLIYLAQQEFEKVLQEQRAPSVFRQAFCRAVATLGRTLRGDMPVFLHWIFGRLLSPSTTETSKDMDMDTKSWLLFTLREFLDLPANGPLQSTAWVAEHIGSILTELQTFLDAMESPVYLPKTLDVIQIIAEKHPESFTNSFKDIVDLLVGWSIDPNIPKNNVSLIADTFKKLWPFWLQHIDFSLELARHLISDIEGLVQVHCNPRATQVPHPDADILKDRSHRLPQSAITLMRCFHAVMYVITFAGFPSLNAECRTPLPFQANAYESYLLLVQWCLELIVAVGRKYEDRGWLSQGYGFIKFLSRALGNNFMPHQQIAVECIMLDCRLLVDENNAWDSPLVKRAVDDWIESADEILALWEPHISNKILPAFMVPSVSPLLKDLRRAYHRDPSFLRKLHNWSIRILQALEAESKDASQTNEDKAGSLDEVVLEMHDIFGRLIPLNTKDHDSVQVEDMNASSGTFIHASLSHVLLGLEKQRATSTSYCEYVSSFLKEDVDVLIDLLLWDCRFLADAAQYTAGGLDGAGLLVLLSSMIENMGRVAVVNNRIGLGTKIRGPLLLSGYAVARSQSFFSMESKDHRVDQKENPQDRSLSYFQMQLKCILTAAQFPDIGHDEKKITICWFYELMDSILNDTKCLAANPLLIEGCAGLVQACVEEFRSLLGSVRSYDDGYFFDTPSPPHADDLFPLPDVEADGEIRGEFALVWKSCIRWTDVLRHFGFRSAIERIVRLIFNVVIARVHDIDKAVAERHFAVLASMRPISTLMASNTQRDSHDDPFLLAKMEVMSKPPSGTFRSKHFQLVVTQLGMEAYFLQSDEPGVPSARELDHTDWLERLFHVCQSATVMERSAAPTSGSPDAVRIDTWEDPLIFWALWESARYCVLSRLRTPLGSPVQTFASIERVLKDSVANFGRQALCPGDTSEHSPATCVYKCLASSCFVNSAVSSLIRDAQRLRHLLMLIDLLEIQIRNAAEGTYHASPASTLFFHTNKRTCDEWFMRIRKHLVAGGNLAGSAAFTIKHGMEYLAERSVTILRHDKNDKAAFAADIESVAVDICDALVSYKDADTLYGIAAWLEKVIPQRSDELSPSDGQPSVRLLKKSDVHNNAGDSSTFSFTWARNAADIAEGRYETAIPELRNKFQASIKEGKISFTKSLSSLVQNITSCYLQLRDWDGLAEWNGMLKTVNQDARNTEDMSPFDLDHHRTALSAWSDVTGPYQVLNSDRGLTLEHSFDIAGIQQVGLPRAYMAKAEGQLWKALSQMRAEDLPNAQEHLASAHQLLQEITKLHTETSPHALTYSLVQVQLAKWIENVNLSAKKSDLAGLLSECDDDQALASLRCPDLSTLNLLHNIVAAVLQTNFTALEGAHFEIANENLRFTVGRLARKSENYALARRASKLLDHLGFSLQDLKCRYDFAKLLYADGKAVDALNTVLSTLDKLGTPRLDQFGNNGRAEFKEGNSAVMYSKHLLLLSSWIQAWQLNTSEWPAVENALRRADFANDVRAAASEEKSQAAFVGSIAERCLVTATAHTPMYPKAWLNYGHFCYHQGRKALEDMTGKPFKVLELFPLEMKHMFEELARTFTPREENVKVILEIISQELVDSTKQKPRDDHPPLKGVLRATFPELEVEAIEKIGCTMRTVKHSVLERFYSAASAYFKFLDVANAAHVASDADNTTATLRILRLFLNIGAYFKEGFTRMFEATPLVPWESVLPQLYARTDHPEAFVRDTIADLLCKIGKTSPHLVVYHAVVESSTEQATSAETHMPWSKRVLQVLKQGSSEGLVTEVQRMVNELKRMTVLWEEMWLHKLRHLHVDAINRLQQIEREANRVEASVSLSETEKNTIIFEYYQTITKPLVTALETLLRTTTCSPSSTPHEFWFQDTYGKRIRDALLTLQSPKDPTMPRAAWTSFEEIHADLTRELQRNRLLKLSNVSPVLARSRDSIIPMPGMPVQDRLVTIQRFDNDLHVLPTKTKPKKLELMGSDGVRYAYLFKGLEDLHLDERIQQLLRIVNQFLMRDKSSAHRGLHARTYPVIPFGQRFGMIKWVDDVIPMFSLYKRWQHREYTAKMLQRKEGDPPPPKPHEQYYSKIRAGLQRHGLSKKVARRNWPLDVMREAFQELKKETPTNLLARELSGSSATPADWWRKTKSFVRSVAVMSVIGYVIGLGDRHLDNILLDPATGEVIHIDYNVCFENGRKLRVPETVPFRLTQNIYGAFGVTGVDGVFKIACENTMRVMRENHKTLLTLLEAFVYDPLVDWTKDQAGDLSKQTLEVNVNIGLLCSRIAEKREPIGKYMHAFLSTCVSNGDDHTSKGIQESIAMQAITNRRSGQEEKMTHVNDKDKEASLRDALQKRYVDCEGWIARHSAALLTLKGPYVQRCAADVLNVDPANVFPPFAPTTYVLGANEGHIMRCVEVDQEIFRVTAERATCYQLIVKHLQMYQVLAAPVADLLLNQDYFLKWKGILQTLISTELSQTAIQRVLPSNSDVTRTEHTRKAALEAIMKTTCLAKEEEYMKCSAAVTAVPLEPETAGQELGTLLSNIPASKKPSVLIQCAMLDTLAHFGHLLYVLIKDPLKGETMFSNDSFGIQRISQRSPHVFGRYPFEPDNLHEVHSIASSAVVAIEVLNESAQKSGDMTDSESLHVLQNFVDLLECIKAMQWHVTDVLVPEVILILAQKEDPSTQSLLTDLEALCSVVDNTHDQSSEAFQTVAAKLGAEFPALCAEYGSQPPAGAQAILSSFNHFFTPIINGMRHLPGQKGTNEAQIIHNALMVQQILASQRYYEQAEMETDDPSNEWIANFDFCEIMRESEHFTTATATLKRYLDICIREICMKPMAKLFNKSIKRVGGTLGTERAHDQEKSGRALIGIPFVDQAHALINAHVPLDGELRQQLGALQGFLSRDVERRVQMDISQKGIVHLRRFEARLQQRKLALTRYQLVHESALTYPIRHGATQEPVPIETPRLQFIESLKRDIPLLLQLCSDLRALEGACQILESELAPLLAWSSADSSKEHTISAFADACRTRHAQIMMETQRIQDIIELCDTLVHFETFRGPGGRMQSMEKDTLELVEALEQVVNRPKYTEVVKANSGVSEDEQVFIQEKLRVVYDAYQNCDRGLEDIHKIMKNLHKASAVLPSAKNMTAEIQEYLSQWSHCGQKIKGLQVVSRTPPDRTSLVSTCRRLARMEMELIPFSDVQEKILNNIHLEVARCIKILFSFSSLKPLEIAPETEREELAQSPLQSPAEEKLPESLHSHPSEWPALQPHQPMVVHESEDPLMLEDMVANDMPSPDQPQVVATVEESRRTEGTSLHHFQQDGVVGVDMKITEALAQTGREREHVPQGEERNAYAIHVLRRVKAKLSGRDAIDQGKMTVPEQVDMILEEATNIDNLAAMYEVI
ncbi:hypothetical protein SpCBS45565_g04070 [Spizellomyces sp. 'palustris']|nr:hypothetical protein SpCBS45565_g04070 [Spizellomyces sp. 'palustris']